jgi:antibiotic biosynthesis monooxygenase (ABM) superfamily enzyme
MTASPSDMPVGMNNSNDRLDAIIHMHSELYGKVEPYSHEEFFYEAISSFVVSNMRGIATLASWKNSSNDSQLLYDAIQKTAGEFPKLAYLTPLKRWVKARSNDKVKSNPKVLLDRALALYHLYLENNLSIPSWLLTLIEELKG